MIRTYRLYIGALLLHVCCLNEILADDSDEAIPMEPTPQSINYPSLAHAAIRGAIAEGAKLGVIVLLGNPGGLTTLAIGLTGAQVAGWSYDQVLAYLSQNPQARAAASDAGIDLDALVDEFVFIEEETLPDSLEVTIFIPEAQEEGIDPIISEFVPIDEAVDIPASPSNTTLTHRILSLGRWGFHQGICCTAGTAVGTTIQTAIQAIPGSTFFSAATAGVGSDLTGQLIIPFLTQRARASHRETLAPASTTSAIQEPTTTQLDGWEAKKFIWDYTQ